MLDTRSAVVIEECLDVVGIIPVVTAFADAVTFQYAQFTPETYRIGVNMQQVCHLFNRKHSEGGRIVFVTVVSHCSSVPSVM